MQGVVALCCGRGIRENSKLHIGAMRIVFAVWFLAHGVAHLPGFLVCWQLRDSSGLPFHTTVLGDSVDIGTVGIRLIGVGWLLAAVAFAVLAAATILRVK